MVLDLNLKSSYVIYDNDISTVGHFGAFLDSTSPEIGGPTPILAEAQTPELDLAKKRIFFSIFWNAFFFLDSIFNFFVIVIFLECLSR